MSCFTTQPSAVWIANYLISSYPDGQGRHNAFSPVSKIRADLGNPVHPPLRGGAKRFVILVADLARGTRDRHDLDDAGRRAGWCWQGKRLPARRPVVLGMGKASLLVDMRRTPTDAGRGMDPPPDSTVKVPLLRLSRMRWPSIRTGCACFLHRSRTLPVNSMTSPSSSCDRSELQNGGPSFDGAGARD